MDERYRLVFRGEVLEGQHAAIVKKKLGAVLKVAGEKLDALFAGKPVVIRKDVDTVEATRYEAAFKKAGARLRVLPVENVADEAEVAKPVADATFDLAPVGELLRPQERRQAPASKIRTDHLTVAKLGTGLAPARAPAPEIDVPDWPLAELGERLSDEARVVPPPKTPAWSVAAAGTRLQEPKPAAPAPPDTSHLSLDD